MKFVDDLKQDHEFLLIIILVSVLFYLVFKNTCFGTKKTSRKKYVAKSQKKTAPAKLERKRIARRPITSKIELWDELTAKTIFLPPEFEKKFSDHYGDPIVAPFAFRGRKTDYDVGHDNGFPIFEKGKWYSLWGMRPSRDIMSIALGLPKRELEKNPFQQIECRGGYIVDSKWTIHHIYECGLSIEPADEKVKKFTNLTNLVLMCADFHVGATAFVHNGGEGAKWLQWAISELYPETTRLLTQAVRKPADSPGLEAIKISKFNQPGFNELIRMRKYEPAGSKKASEAIWAAMGR